jgi:putative restriction endonuclease
VLDSADLAGGFEFNGERIPLINPQRGIFKPRQMEHLLSIKTVFPRRGARVWYDDQREVHHRIYAGDDVVDYSFMGTDPNSADNRWLRDAMERELPVIYFLGTSPGHYQPIIPTFIVGWHPDRLRVQLAFGALVAASAQAAPPDAPERRYALREVKARLHQASFRDAVLTAYGRRCAISHIPEPRLLDAAHIVMDADEQLGHPIVSNGLPLTKLHHAAFDSNLIGIDPHFRIHVLIGCLRSTMARSWNLASRGSLGRRSDFPDGLRIDLIGIGWHCGLRSSKNPLSLWNPD